MDYEVLKGVISDAISLGVFEGLVQGLLSLGIMIGIVVVGGYFLRFLCNVISKKIKKKRVERSLMSSSEADKDE